MDRGATDEGGLLRRVCSDSLEPDVAPRLAEEGRVVRLLVEVAGDLVVDEYRFGVHLRRGGHRSAVARGRR